MAVSRRSVRPRFTLLLLLLTAVTLIILNGRSDANGTIESLKGFGRDAFAPVQSATSAVFRPFGNAFGGVFHYDDVKSENARLRSQLEDAQASRLRAVDANRERKSLLDQQNLEFAGDIPLTAARVISASSSNFELTVVIDRGANDGVVKNMPVVSGGGLVGRIIDASDTRSTVQLMTAPAFNVGVRLASSGDVGVAEGEGRDRNLRVSLIESATMVNKREPVVTSGLQNSTYPPGIPVGEVSSSPSQKAGTLQREVLISPLVDLGRLTFVNVLLWSPKSQ